MSIYKVAMNILVNWVTNFQPPKSQKSSILSPCFQILGNTLVGWDFILITHYHSLYRAILEIIWGMLHDSSSTRPLLQLPVIQGFRRSEIFRDLLIRAKLKQLNTNKWELYWSLCKTCSNDLSVNPLGNILLLLKKYLVR